MPNCTKCGAFLKEGVKFCQDCGASTQPPPVQQQPVAPTQTYTQTPPQQSPTMKPNVNQNKLLGGIIAIVVIIIVIAAVFMVLVKSDNNGGTGDNGDELNFYEEELVGLWYRYHSYDGSSRYIRLNADRTACKWEEASGSDARESKSSYSYWEISEELSNSKFRVNIQGSGFTGGYIFDYPNNWLYPSGYSDLKHVPSTAGKLCE